jgi:DNA polymerase I
MPFTVDFLGDGAPLAWSLTGTADDPRWTAAAHPDYRPALYAVTARGMAASDPDPAACADELRSLDDALASHPAVVDRRIERKRPGFRFAAQPVLRVAVDRVDAVRDVASFVEGCGPPGRSPFRAFDVDFAPEFRFCLDRDRSPTPGRDPTVLQLGLPRPAAAGGDLSALTVGAGTTGPAAITSGDGARAPAGATAVGALETLRDRLAAVDPDVLAVERGAVVPLVAAAADEHGVDLGLPRVPPGWGADRLPTYQQLAGDSTFESYGQMHHSPARYNVPGRVVVDRSNTFFLHETNLEGCLDLVERSRKPLQELSWASIGDVLTSIQIREARDRDVLVQGRAWRP